MDQIRRHLRQRRLDHRCHAFEHLFIQWIRFRILLTELRDLVDVGVRAGAQRQRAPVEKRRERRRIAFDRFESVVFKSQIADDLRTKEAVDVRGRRDFESGEMLLR